MLITIHYLLLKLYGKKYGKYLHVVIFHQTKLIIFVFRNIISLIHFIEFKII